MDPIKLVSGPAPGPEKMKNSGRIRVRVSKGAYFGSGLDSGKIPGPDFGSESPIQEAYC